MYKSEADNNSIDMQTYSFKIWSGFAFYFENKVKFS